MFHVRARATLQSHLRWNSLTDTCRALLPFHPLDPPQRNKNDNVDDSLKLLGMDILDVSDKLGRWSCSDLGSLRSPITTDSKFSLVPLSYS